jgi:hypothetical protein
MSTSPSSMDTNTNTDNVQTDKQSCELTQEQIKCINKSYQRICPFLAFAGVIWVPIMLSFLILGNTVDYDRAAIPLRHIDMLNETYSQVTIPREMNYVAVDIVQPEDLQCGSDQEIRFVYKSGSTCTVSLCASDFTSVNLDLDVYKWQGVTENTCTQNKDDVPYKDEELLLASLIMMFIFISVVILVMIVLCVSSIYNCMHYNDDLKFRWTNTTTPVVEDFKLSPTRTAPDLEMGMINVVSGEAK